jgi:hypothetical protein
MAMVMAARRPAAAAPPAAPVWRQTLWRPEDFMRWVISIGVGGVVLVASWYVCAGDASFYRQIGPLDAASAGLILAGLGNVMWLLRGRRNVGERRRALLPDVAALITTEGDSGELDELGERRRVSDVAPEGGAATAAAPTAEHVFFVAGDGLARYHRPDCTLASGRTWSGATRADHEAAGRQPCGVCRP